MVKASRPLSGAELKREHIARKELEREDRIRSWSQARAEGIREGLLMAMTAALGQATGHGAGEAIKVRGNRHFGDAEWQTKPRPG